MTPPRGDADRVLLGHIAGAHGLKGEVRLVSHTERPADIAAYGPLEDESGARRFTVLDVRPARGALIARLEGVEDRAAAEALKGAALHVARDALPDPEPETWYHADLIGLAAVSPEGEALGEVVAVRNFGAGDLLEIRPAAGGPTVLAPFTAAVAPEIDLGGGRLVLAPPEGLFD